MSMYKRQLEIKRPDVTIGDIQLQMGDRLYCPLTFLQRDQARVRLLHGEETVTVRTERLRAVAEVVPWGFDTRMADLVNQRPSLVITDKRPDIVAGRLAGVGAPTFIGRSGSLAQAGDTTPVLAPKCVSEYAEKFSIPSQIVLLFTQEHDLEEMEPLLTHYDWMKVMFAGETMPGFATASHPHIQERYGVSPHPLPGAWWTAQIILSDVAVRHAWDWDLPPGIVKRARGRSQSKLTS